MKTIEAGQTLTARSIGDHNCVFTVEVISRKGGFATVKVEGAQKRIKVHNDGETEFLFALGRYSMAPTFRP